MKTIIAVLAVAVCALALLYGLGASSGHPSPEPAAISAGQVQRKDPGQSIIATGIIKPKVGAEVKVGAQISGVVERLFVKTGSRVRKNDLLAVLSPQTYQAQKDKASALKAISSTELKYAELELTRQTALYRQQLISQQQFEAASQRCDLARGSYDQAAADERYAELQLGYTRISAPINGVVASIATQEGETVAAGFVSPTFVTIIDVDQLELWVYVDETDIGRVRQGMAVSFTVDTYPGQSFNGVVETIYPKAEIQNSVVNYVVVVRIGAHGEKVLRPEMTATVHIVTPSNKQP